VTGVQTCALPISGTYTAWLFAQAKARDFWQSPLLPPQHLASSIAAGAAALLIVTRLPILSTVTVIATLVHLILIAAEALTPHPTAHARLAVHEMVRGRYAAFFWIGVILQIAGLFVPPLVLAGLLAYEYAHVGAGQAVPLA